MAAQITAIFLFIGFPLLSVGVVINIVRMADSDPTAIYQSKNSLIICTHDLSINITTNWQQRKAQRREIFSWPWDCISAFISETAELGANHTYCWHLKWWLFSKCMSLMWTIHLCVCFICTFSFDLIIYIPYNSNSNHFVHLNSAPFLKLTANSQFRSACIQSTTNAKNQSPTLKFLLFIYTGMHVSLFLPHNDFFFVAIYILTILNSFLRIE